MIRSVRRDITEWIAYFAVNVTREGLFLVTMKRDAFVKLVQLGKGFFSYIQVKRFTITNYVRPHYHTTLQGR